LRVDLISDTSKVTQIRDFIKDMLETIKPIKVVAKSEKIKKYCSMINETNPIYLEQSYAKSKGYPKPLVPLGYLPTLITPIIQKLFLSELPKLVKGIIHTTSEIKHFRPIFVDTDYITNMKFENISEKTGSKGTYIQTDFIITLKDKNGEQIAIDKHMFFMKK